MRKLKLVIEYLFYLFIFLLPWQTRWIFQPRQLNNGFWEYGSFSLYGTEILLWLILILFFIYLLVSRPKRRLKRINFRNPKFLVLIAVYLLLITSLLSILWAEDKPLAAFSSFRLLEAMALFFLIVNFNFNLKKFFITLVSASALQGLLAFWQFSQQYIFANKWLGLALHRPDILGDFVVETATGRWLRAYGSLPHPNLLAGFLVFGLIGVLYLWLKSENWQEARNRVPKLRNSVPRRHSVPTRRAWLLFCGFLIILGLILSFSRSGWLAALAVMIIFWWLALRDKDKRQPIFKFTLYYLLITLILVLILSQPFITRLGGGQRLEIKSVQQRLTQFDQAQQLASQNWLIGVGIGNYTLAVFKDIDSSLPVWDYQPVHNVFLLILVELGLVGLIIFIFLYFCIFIHIWQPKNYLGLSILSALGVILLFDHYLWTLYFGVVLFWLGLGLGLKRV